ncbi:MAG: PH domain-containing protein [Candidatus Roizmanbacteria bacterium]|nr:PH domain-containing protein [Candidatus Roizmanbacteria bacterium]
MKKLAPEAQVIFGINALIATFFLLGFIFTMPIVVMIMIIVEEGVVGLVPVVTSLILLYVLLVIIIPLWYGPQAYKNYRYQLTKSGIEIEKGIIWKKQITIPYERVQNIDILRGPIARAFNVANVHIQTAGISGAALTEGVIPSVLPEEALQIKNGILAYTKYTPRDL